MIRHRKKQSVPVSSHGAPVKVKVQARGAWAAERTVQAAQEEATRCWTVLRRARQGHCPKQTETALLRARPEARVRRSAGPRAPRRPKAPPEWPCGGRRTAPYRPPIRGVDNRTAIPRSLTVAKVGAEVPLLLIPAADRFLR